MPLKPNFEPDDATFGSSLLLIYILNLKIDTSEIFDFKFLHYFLMPFTNHNEDHGETNISESKWNKITFSGGD